MTEEYTDWKSQQKGYKEGFVMGIVPGFILGVIATIVILQLTGNMEGVLNSHHGGE